MGLIDWVRSFSAKRPPPESASPSAAPPPQAAEGAVLAGLNFKTAIDAHMKWKVRLESCLSDDNKESLQVEVVSRDDQCVLGKW
ncbi:MAG: CZB domain-containing protein, partial [Parasulfuritortus sp.]|nr:CZB domain-containing protein [Parasulfuritortus sp.]